MTRTVAREIAVHLSYQMNFTEQSAAALLEEQMTRETFETLAKDERIYAEYPDDEQMAYIRRVVNGVGNHGYELDQYIEKYAIGWRFERIPKVAAAIMRVAMYEVLYIQEIPNSAAISAAVELAKKYEDEKMVSFINGVLGAFARNEALLS